MLRATSSLMLLPKGSIGRRDFWIGLILLSSVVTVFNSVLTQLGGSTLAFLISLPFPFIALHMTYCIYGKRLRDMGRSVWPLTGMIALLIWVMVMIMLSYGGSEYFAEFSQYNRKDDIDPTVRDAIREKYQTELAQADKLVWWSLSAIIAGFTIWVGLSKPVNNAYNNFERSET